MIKASPVQGEVASDSEAEGLLLWITDNPPVMLTHDSPPYTGEAFNKEKDLIILSLRLGPEGRATSLVRGRLLKGENNASLVRRRR